MKFNFKNIKLKKLSKTTLLGALIPIIAIITFTCFTKTKEIAQRPNILWIVADDLGTDLNCYGESLVHSPNLDKLVSEGVLFENLHTVTAVCSPSRSSLITGMYPVSIDCHQHRTRYKKKLPKGVKPITEYFKEAGYFVCNGSNKKISKKGKTDYNFVAKFDSLYDGTHWNQRKKDQPFFAQVQIFFPHRPFYTDSVNPVDPDKVKLPPYYVNHPIARADWAKYLETVQLVDVAVGEVLKQLKEDGLDENTIVFFFGDQGRPHVRAKQFLYNPGTNTPLIVRWPDKSKAGKISKQLVSNIDISVASLALAGIKIPKHLQGVDFLSKTADKREEIYTMRDRRDETVDRIRSVRDERFKYIRNYYTDRPYTQSNAYKKRRYPVLSLMQMMYKNGQLDSVQSKFFSDYRPAEELYDLKNDPFEINNLAKDMSYKKELEKLRNKLDIWVKKYDKGTYPENESEIKYATDLMKKRYEGFLKQIGLGTNATDEDIVKYWKKRLLKD